ncbi:MAG: hypothetical protein AB2421_14275 [Thermotaleaceae bacterium]
MKKILLFVLVLVVGVAGWGYWQWTRIDIDFDQGNGWRESSTQSGKEAGSGENDSSQEVRINPKEAIEQEVQKELENRKIEEITGITPQQLEKAVLEKYQGAFATMKAGYQEEIDRLISRGKEEYLAMSEQEKKKSKLTLGLKYIKLGNALEAACDENFNKVLEQMKKELTENGLPVHSIKEAQAQYEKEKSERRKYLMDKARGAL